MAKRHYDNKLYYGDNLDVLIKYVKDESVDLCYIDPPFNSKRNYNQIYNNIGKDDKAQAQAFIDTWTWGEDDVDAYYTITHSSTGAFPKQCVELIIGLKKALGEGSLMAYLLSMTVRIAQIYRVLKPTGSFYLHCDTTASHYLKIIIDSIFVSHGGDFRNEIAWHYSGWNKKLLYGFEKRHDCILFYGKSDGQIFNSFFEAWESKKDYVKKRKQKIRIDEEDGREYVLSDAGGGKRVKRYLDEAMAEGVVVDDVWNIDKLNNSAKEKLGYPTQKPEALLERIIKASSNEGDVVLDAFCGCGTTVAVAQKLNRKWIGIDITYQSISVILKRLQDHFGQSALDNIELHGVPQDIESAMALANKKDDRVRKEFEKWAVLTYSDNKAIINEKKGADSGIDGIAFMLVGHDDHKQVLFSVKSGHLGVSMIRDFCHVVDRDKAALGIFLSLEEPTRPMIQEALNMGKYTNPLTNQSYPKIEIVTIKEVLEGKRLNLPQAVEVLKEAKLKKEHGNNPLGLKFD